MSKTFISQKKLKKRCVSSHSEGIFFSTMLDFFFMSYESFFYKISGLFIFKFNKSIFFRFLLLNFLNLQKVFFTKFNFLYFQITQKFFSSKIQNLNFKKYKSFFWRKTKNYFFTLKRIKSENKNTPNELETHLFFNKIRETQVFRFFDDTFPFFENDRLKNKLSLKTI